MIMKVRKENENLVFTPVEDDRNYSIPTAFFEAAYPQYAADKKKKEKQD